MKRTFNNRKNVLALCLSALMLTSVTALASCKDGNTADSSSSSSSSAATVKDTGLIKNSNFKTDLLNDKTPMVKSVTGWGSATVIGSATSSKTASGMIDTSKDAWNYLTGSYYENPDEVKNLSESQAEKVWDQLTAKDKLNYYKAWEAANKDGDIDKDLSFYESINISLGDIPTVNPGTPLKEGDEGYDEDDQKVLMIHNENPLASNTSTATYKAIGTAQKFSSSSTVTLPAGASAQLSVWVKTANLECSATDGSVQKAIGKGAFISVSNSVGGTSLPAYEVTNIQADEWTQYSFYLRGSSYTQTTFSLTLGLGRDVGGRLGYVNGYAFFDNVECELIEDDAFEDERQTIDAAYIANFASEKEEKTFDTSRSEHANAKTFALDFAGGFDGLELFDANAKYEATVVDGYTALTGVSDTTVPTGLKGGFDGSNDITRVYAPDELKTAAESGNPYLKAVYEDYLKDNAFSQDKDVILLLSAKGAAYTATPANEIKFSDYNAEYLAISVFVKTSDMYGKTGAGITLIDGLNKTSFSAIDTSDVEPVTIGDNEDVYAGWQQYLFFVEKGEDTADDISFQLAFTFGPTDINAKSTASEFSEGFAAFTNLQIRTMDQKEYESAKAGTYAKLVTVTGKQDDSAAGNSGFDSAASTPTDALEKGLANLKNYKGVDSNSDYVNNSSALGTNAEVNQNENAGLLNKENFVKEGGIYDTLKASADKAWFNGLFSGATDAEEAWNSVIGSDSSQPLVIWNETATSYGYLGKSTSISANSYKAVSVRVKVSAGAKANVYLIDTDDTTYQNTLSASRQRTYWYDDDGNICVSDPNEHGFNARTDIAFYLKADGLYYVNKNWSGRGDIPLDRAYANLANYDKDENGNLVIAENGISYDYSDAWNNAGVIDIVYYKGENGYYTYTAGAKKDVYDLAGVAALTPRYTAIAAQGMHFEISDTNGEWVTVTFYVHTGNVAKNYRLEVWSGDRTGTNNSAEKSYVLFDLNTPVSAETYFPTLSEQYKNLILEKYDGKIENVPESEMFYSAFSFYDSNIFRRYDETLDKNNIGDAYEKSFVPSEKSVEGIAYLSYYNAEELSYTKFVDYSLSEQEVTKTVETDNETEEEETDADSETNIWLLISSISIAAILVLAVISLIVQKLLKKYRRKHGARAREEVAEKAKKSKKK